MSKKASTRTLWLEILGLRLNNPTCMPIIGMFGRRNQSKNLGGNRNVQPNFPGERDSLSVVSTIDK